MSDAPQPIEQSSEWWELAAHQAEIADVHLRELFASDPNRGDRFNMEVGDLYVDYAKHRLNDETLSKLFALARRADVEALRDAMWAGEHINVTEDRAVLHIALRAPKGVVFTDEGHDVVPDVHEVLDRMASFSNRVRSGEWVGHTGKRIRTVINIGIGGSDLGPRMAHEALLPYAQENIDVRFVSNVDGNEFYELTAILTRPRRFSSLRRKPLRLSKQ